MHDGSVFLYAVRLTFPFLDETSFPFSPPPSRQIKMKNLSFFLLFFPCYAITFNTFPPFSFFPVCAGVRD